MTEDELKAIDQRLAAMSERCDRVIAKEKPLGKPMPALDFKPRINSRKQGAMPPVGMSLHPHAGGNRAKYVPLPESDHGELCDGSIESIFADFERQFDEMAQAHRQRG